MVLKLDEHYLDERPNIKKNYEKVVFDNSDFQRIFNYFLVHKELVIEKMNSSGKMFSFIGEGNYYIFLTENDLTRDDKRGTFTLPKSSNLSNKIKEDLEVID